MPLIAALVLVGSAAASAGAPGAPAKAIPSLSEIRQAVVRHFRALPDYRAGDLVTREEVEPLLGQLQRMGLPLPDAKKIVEKVPAKNEFLAEQLRATSGRKFMREISSYQGAYDRLDRLSRLPHGQQTVRDLIRGPDGYKMIEYMTTTPGGKAMGDQLSNSPDEDDFNAPTGRIYTAKMLLLRLEQSRAAALKAKKK